MRMPALGVGNAGSPSETSIAGALHCLEDVPNSRSWRRCLPTRTQPLAAYAPDVDNLDSAQCLVVCLPSDFVFAGLFARIVQARFSVTLSSDFVHHIVEILFI